MAIHTDAEARGHWCPFGRVLGDGVDASAYNRERPGLAASVSPCIGRRCMAWRWHEEASLEYAQARGYCGLAGKP